ncbi:WD domain, G-beta repeat protein [Trichuris suis]|nr:WD domain, G-beta repeat protein [Trichuris suis]
MPLRLDVKRKLLARSDRVKSVDLHPTEPWMLCSLYNGNVHTWNYETQTLVKSLEVCAQPVRVAKFVVRKSWVLTGSDDMQIRAFNYNTLDRVTQFEAHSDYVRSIAVHPTLPYFLSSSDDMTIKLWDWDNNFQCKQVFEGHAHYVMQVVFNPKDSNTFASASLDRTVKVWQLGSSQPNFTLEGHEKGVNCVDYYHGGDKPYLISGADDKLVKIWDYQALYKANLSASILLCLLQNKTCVATLEGHVQNVSAVCFHPDFPIIITGSEDNTVRIWHGNTYRLETTLNYGLDRVWVLYALKGHNTVAIGYDEGSIIIKLGREDPAVTMDSSGKILWCRNMEIQQANVKAIPGETEIANGERLPLAVKDMCSCDIYPQSIQYNSNGRFVVVCGDGEYIIYTALAIRNKSFGSALEFVWAKEPNMYAIRESGSSIKIFQNFKDPLAVQVDSQIEGIFGGTLLGVRAGGQLSFFDWTTRSLVRRIDISPKAVFWSEMDTVCITTEDTCYILKYNSDVTVSALESGQPIPEDGLENAFNVEYVFTDTVATGTWVGDCFVYTTSANRLNYFVGGDTVTVAHLDRPLYILGYLPSENRLYLSDKELNIVSYQLMLAVLNYQTAVMRHDLDMANKILPTIPKDNLNRVARFLERQGYTTQALAVSQDADHRFELALKIGQLDVARQIALESEAEEKWRHLNAAATAKGDFALASECLLKAKDYGGLLLHASAFGSLELLNSVIDKATKARQFNISFLARFLAGDLKKCLEILVESDRLPEAAFFACTYVPSEMSRIVALWKDKIATSHPKVADSLADPKQYDNLFPDFEKASELELLRDTYLREPLKAEDYRLLKPDYTVSDLIEAKEKGRTEQVEEPYFEDHERRLSRSDSVDDPHMAEDKDKHPTSDQQEEHVHSAEEGPDIARSSQRQPDLVPAVGGPDVLMHAPSRSPDRPGEPLFRHAAASSLEEESAERKAEERSATMLDDDFNLDLDNLDVSNVELFDDDAEFGNF